MLQKKFLPLYLLALLLILGVLLFGFFSGSKSGQIHRITLTDEGFSPEEININPSDSIEFSSTLDKPFWPASDLHPTHGIYPEFDPQEPVDPDKSWTFEFKKTGRWKYHDHLNPVNRGTINVRP